MTKKSTAVNQAWKAEAVVIAENERETVYYQPSKRRLFATDGAGSINLTIADAPEYIKRNGMTQVTTTPTWDEMTARYSEIRLERREALK